MKQALSFLLSWRRPKSRDSTESSVQNGNERANDGEEANTVDESVASCGVLL